MTSSESVPSNGELQPSSREGDASVMPSSRFGFGLMLAIIGLCAVYFAGDIQESPFETSDPGPRALPTALGWMMLTGAVLEMACGLLQLRRRSTLTTQAETPPSPSVEVTGVTSATAILRVSILTVVLVAYVAMITRAGFYLSTAVFVFGMTLSVRSKWWVTLLTTVSILVLVHLLFGRLFQIPLPRGEWFS